MIGFGKNDISALSYGAVVIVAVSKGIDAVWTSIRSCFGSGAWMDDKPWADDEGWKD